MQRFIQATFPMQGLLAWRHVSSLRIAVLLGIMFSLLRFHGCRYLDLMDLRAQDYRFLQRGAGTASPDIVIVAIDDGSLEQFGRWPWPRAVMAQLLERLVQADAAVVGFDIVQSESGADRDLGKVRERLSGLDDRTWNAVRSALDQGAADDERLAQVVHASGRAVLGYFFDVEREEDGARPVQLPTYNLVQNSRGHKGEISVPHAHMAQLNLPALTTAARSLGYFNFFPDEDGSFRRAPLAIVYKDQIALPLSLAMLQVYRPHVPLAIQFTEAGVQSIRFGATPIPVGADGQMLINFRGPGKTFRHIAAADVLHDRVPADMFRGKLVLVGVTATAVADVRVTPVDRLFPGVEIHANVLDNILRRDFVFRPASAVGVETALILVLALLLGLLLHYVRGVSGALVAVSLLGTYVTLSQELFGWYGVALSLVYPLLAIVLTYSTIGLQQYVIEEREKRKIRNAFSLYFTPALAELVSEHPETLALGGDKRELTVLFSDIRGFTSISERLEPETLVELLNAFLGEMTEVIFAHDGMLDKYVGDAIMAVWGAPLPQADHAARACRTALDMMDHLHSREQEWQQRGWPRLDIGIGLNTGPMVVGNMGSARRLSYTVIGDNVNLGSRLEGLNKLYGTHVLASEATVHAAGDAVIARELDLVRVKGKRLPVRIFELVARGDDSAGWAQLLEQFANGIAAYRGRQWQQAIARFERVLQLRPQDAPAQLYVQRCREMAVSPPPADWDGVMVIDVK